MWYSELKIHDNFPGRPTTIRDKNESLESAQALIKARIRWVAAKGYSDSAYVKDIVLTNVKPDWAK